MKQNTKNLIWLVVAIVLLLFGEMLIKDQTAAHVVTIIASLLLLKVILKTYSSDSKSARFWGCAGITAVGLNILMILIQLSL